jgi:flavin reductase (DIM6/NTAB) family NADH-FMN oxidoreductase RutF
VGKEGIELHVVGYVDVVIHPFLVRMVTTVDYEGRINAAPYSLVILFCPLPKNPQMLFIANKSWHPAKNIEATGEFVPNYLRADQLKDITETSHLYPPGVNELVYTQYTPVASNFDRLKSLFINH